MTDAAQRSILTDQAGRFAARHVGLGLLGRRPRDNAAWAHALSEGGWAGATVPEESGGVGLAAPDLCVVAEAFGRKLLPPFAPLAATLGALGLCEAPSARALLARALAGAAIALPALRPEGEPLLEGDVRLALKDGVGTLVGVTVAMPGGAGAHAFLVEAMWGEERALVLAPRDGEGTLLSIERTVDGEDFARVSFEGAPVAPEQVLATGAAATAPLDRVRLLLQVTLAAEALGAASELFDRTLDHLRTRRQFGRPIGSFQALQHRAVDVFVDIELSRALIHQAAELVDAPRPGVSELVAAARARMSETALRVLRWSAQMHGAMGFTDECDVGLFLKRLLTATRCYQTPDAHRRRLSDASNVADAPDLFALLHADSDEDAAFRQEVRVFLNATLPAHLCDLATRPNPSDAIWWHKKLYERGWIAPSWPKAFGGMDASLDQRLILFDEFARKGAPELSSQAIYHIGPILIRFGTPEQKQRHLPAMVKGDAIWCQGYSEPNSGSDLASLSTSGRVDGERIIINGQKIWTTGGHIADWMFALVRTDPNAVDRRKGISMVLVDMLAPGVLARPIRTIAGEDEFAEVFFDDVEAPLDQVVGGLNNGWAMATAVLETERLMGATPQRILPFVDRTWRVARASGVWADEPFRDRFARAQIDALAFCAAFERVLGAVRTGQNIGAIASALKIASCDILQNLADLLVEAAAGHGADSAPFATELREVHVGRTFLQARRATIYGGTSEIQRDIIARRILNLGKSA